MDMKYEVVAAGLVSPEGPCVHPDGQLFVCESERGISWHDTQGGRGDVIEGMAPNGAAFGPDGALYVAEWRERAILRVSLDGSAVTLFDTYDGTALHGPNDICFFPDGSYYFTDPARDGDSLDAIITNPNGRVFYVGATGDLREVASGLQFSNGLHWTRDMQRLLVCESGRNRILSYEIGDAGRLAGCYEYVGDLPGWPDGMCMDVAGNIYVAVYGSGIVFQVDDCGKVIRQLAFPGKAVTNCALGGHDRRTLFVTEVETGTLYAVRVDTPGIPLFPFPDAFTST